jgi:hypothetical protein
MATNTSKGIIYPTSGDSIAPLETHFALMANSTNDALIETDGLITDLEIELQDFKDEVGRVPVDGVFIFTGPTSAGTPVNVTVSLPTPYFPAAPTVVSTVSGVSTSGAYFAVLHSVTSSQFQARIWRTIDGSAESLNLNWIAK